MALEHASPACSFISTAEWAASLGTHFEEPLALLSGFQPVPSLFGC